VRANQRGGHLCLDPAISMISGQLRCEQGCVFGDRGRAVLFPSALVLADRQDRPDLAVEDSGVTAARVLGTVIVSSSFGSAGLLGSLLGVDFTARTSEVAVSIIRWTLRNWRRPSTECLRICHSEFPTNLLPVLSTSQVAQTVSPVERHLDREGFMRPAKGSVVWRGPVQVHHFRQDGHRHGLLAQREFEQDLGHRSKLDRGSPEHRRPARACATLAQRQSSLGQFVLPWRTAKGSPMHHVERIGNTIWLLQRQTCETTAQG